MKSAPDRTKHELSQIDAHGFFTPYTHALAVLAFGTIFDLHTINVSSA